MIDNFQGGSKQWGSSHDKKVEQLGEHPATASNRLVKDLIWHHIASKVKCYQCGEEMHRGTYSIEHKDPWLDSEDPKKTFFDIENISFSHLSCNVAASRNKKK